MIPFNASGLPGPFVPVSTPDELMQSALDQPLSIPSQLLEGGKQALDESFGAGTAIRDFSIPEGNPTPFSQAETLLNGLNPAGQIYNLAKQAYQGAIGQDRTPMSEAEYKASPWFRDGVPWDSAMTSDRAHALATWDDTKRVREFYAQKRPITAFFGNLLGSALDPINYIPVGGEILAAKTGLGPIGRAMLGSSIDAAGNTAAASIITAPQRTAFGDDTSWQSTVSNIAMAGLIGGAFGALHGLIGDRAHALPPANDIADQIGTIGRMQESRIALNEAIDAVINGRDVELSPNGLAAVDGAVPDVARVIQPNIDFQNIGEVQRQIRGMADGGPTPMGITRFLASKGGIADQGGELRAMDLQDHFVPGSGRLVRQNGRSLDAAREIAAEAGYFPQYGSIDNAMQQSTIDDLLNALADERAGKPAYTSEDQARAASIEAQGKAQGVYDEALRSVDSAATDSSLPKEIRTRAAEIIYRENADPHDALERAIMEDYYANGSGIPIVDARGQEITGFDQADAFGNAGQRAPDANGGGGLGGRAEGQSAADGRALRGARTADYGKASNATGPKPDAPPELKTAEQRIGKSEDIRALAEQHGVDESGNYPEANEIAQIEKEGRLTAEDRAALQEADDAFDRASAYGEALKAAATCII